MTSYDLAVRILLARHFNAVHPSRRGHAAVAVFMPSEMQTLAARPVCYIRSHRRAT